MRKLIWILAITAALAFSAFAQSSQPIEATTKDGRAVLLKADGTWSFVPSNTKFAGKKLGVTAAGFAAISPGMTYDQVVAILGRTGEVAVDQKTDQFHTIIYRWKADRGSLGANMSVTFQNDKMVSKAQAGLK